MIQWITMKDWAEDDDDENEGTEADFERRREEYWRHLDSISDRLPADLMAADRRLHDAELLAIEYDVDSKRLRLRVEPLGSPQEWWTFTQVSQYNWINHRVNVGGRPGFGEMGYSELRLVPSGFQMDILLTSGLELCIEAGGFFLSAETTS